MDTRRSLQQAVNPVFAPSQCWGSLLNALKTVAVVFGDAAVPSQAVEATQPLPAEAMDSEKYLAVATYGRYMWGEKASLTASEECSALFLRLRERRSCWPTCDSVCLSSAPRLHCSIHMARYGMTA